MPIARVSLNMAAGSFDIDRRLQSCNPIGAPTVPMVCVLVAAFMADDGTGEPTLAEREQAIAGNSAATARVVKRFIVTPIEGRAKVTDVRAQRQSSGESRCHTRSGKGAVSS